MEFRRCFILFSCLCFSHLFAAGALQSGSSDTGWVEGRVILLPKGTGVRNADVTVVELGISAETDGEGRYKIAVPPGTYDVIAHLTPLTSEVKAVAVAAGQSVVVDLPLVVSPLEQEITVTASGHEETTFRAIQSVTSLDSVDLAQRAHVSLGEVLQDQPGVSKRSWGPGSSRPVVRGFDGDRVLVLQNGIQSSSLSSQSGDHGETMDVLNMERLEIVRGPAALLYGSNAIGGVINAINRHHEIHEHPHEGTRGYLTGIAGSTDSHGGLLAGVEYGTGDWLFWGSGGGQRTGDYHAPSGVVENSKTRSSNASAGFGRYTDRLTFSLNYNLDDRRYGIPFAGFFHEHDEDGSATAPLDEEVDLALRAHTVRVDTGIKELSHGLDHLHLSVTYADYGHKELDVTPVAETAGTVFDNQQLVYRGVFEQDDTGKLRGSFGFWGLLRDYRATGEEALSPPVDQKSFALFSVQELNGDWLRFQFGGRLEHARYNPEGMPGRSFTGLSGAAGVHVLLWPDIAFVGNYTRAFRAPALEELYNNGPHLGNLAFEIGNPHLKTEKTNGIELSLRQSSSRIKGQLSFFYYDVSDFIFLAPTGALKEGLIEADYTQGDARYLGTELKATAVLHPTVSLNLQLDSVDAELRNSGQPLPRIPPLRGIIGLDMRRSRLSFNPQVIMARAQDQLFATETRTAGYTTFNLNASYTLPGNHFVQVFSAELYNLTDRLYRNHLSLIKELAPEIGRGVRFSYTVRYF